jgi:ABC-type glycerol-3-phosphate transport system substrate-binding protein
MMNWWAGRMIEGIARKGCIEPLDSVWNPAKQYYEEHVWKATEVDGHIYGLPGQDWQDAVVINKPLFEEMGLNKWPDTWDQFEDIVEALIEAGLDYPIGQNNADGWPAFHWFEYLYTFMHGTDAYVDIMDGKAKYTDKEALDVFEYWAELMGKGWFGPDPSKNNAMTSTTMPPLWRQKKLGMWVGTITVIASWWPDLQKDDIIQGFAMPPLPGAKTGKEVIWGIWPFCVTSGHPNKADSMLVAEFFLTKEGADVYNETSGLNNPHKLADPSKWPWQ